MNDKKDPLLVRRVTEQVSCFDEALTVENVVMNGKKYDLKISNPNRDGGYLHLRLEDEREGGYLLEIKKGKLRIMRFDYEDGDFESTGGVAQVNLLTNPEGDLFWSKYHPYSPRKQSFFEIDLENKEDN